MATVRVTLSHTHWSASGGRVVWSPGVADYISLGRSLSQVNTETTLLGRLEIPQDSSWPMGIQLSRNNAPAVDTGPDFSHRFRTAGTMTFLASNGSQLVVDGISDEFEPYNWRPSNINEVYAFGNVLAGLSDRALTATFTDNVNQTPHYADSTGDAVHWTTGVAITPLVVPEASGSPIPTYAVQGTLPAGITFAVATRTFSGTPTAAGSGTLTVRATNSQGHTDWTVSYITNAPPPVRHLLLGNIPISAAYLGDAQVGLYLGELALVTAGPLTPWQFFAGRSEDLAVEFTAEVRTGDQRQYFQWDTGNPGQSGTLIRQHPATMFTDTSFMWIGRLWHNLVGSSFVHFHRRGAAPNMSVFIPMLLNTGGIYIINVTNSQHYCFRPTDSTDGVPTGTLPSSVGGGFVNYTGTQVVDEKHHSTPTNVNAEDFMDNLSGKRVIVAFSFQHEYIPVF